MVGASVTVLCTSNRVPGDFNFGTGTTAPDGNFSVVVADSTAPCVLEAVSGSTKLHSLVASDDPNAGLGITKANITPVTEMVFAYVTDTNETVDYFAGFRSSKLGDLSRTRVNAAVKQVVANLTNSLSAQGVSASDLEALADPFGGTLVPAVGSQAGNAYDRVLDKIKWNPVKVKIIAINDFHGNIDLPSSTNGGTVVLANGTSTKSVLAGGAAYMASFIKQMKAKSNGANSIVVGAGDLIGASPFSSSITNDEAAVDVLNNLGLEVSAVGNHEFDRGITELKRIQNGGCRSAGQGGIVGTNTCLQSGGVFAGAKYTYLAANVVDTTTSATVLPSTFTKTFGTVKIGFVGLTLKGTGSLVSAAGTTGLRFDDEIDVINKSANALKASGASSVVVLIHQGGQSTASTINDKTCPGFSGDIVPILNGLNKNVDVVVSGHTHMEYVCNFPAKAAGKNILVTSTGFYGGAVSEIDLVINPSTGLASASANTVPVIQNVPKNAGLPAGYTALDPDTAMAALVKSYVDKSATAAKLQVGTITGDILRATYLVGGVKTRDETNESPLANLMADSYLAAAPLGADIAFVNPGSVRSDLTFVKSGRADGAVTFGELATIEPFGNTLQTMSLTGTQIIRLLEQQWEAPNNTAKTNAGTGTFGRILGVSSGFTYSYSTSATAGAKAGTGSRLVAGSVQLNGVVIDPATSYKVITNTFLAVLGSDPLGPDNFTILTKGAGSLNTNILDLDAFIDYFKNNPGLSAPASRVTIAP